MDNGDTVAGAIEVCNTLAPSAKRLIGQRPSGMAVLDDNLTEFPSQSPFPVAAMVEYLAQFSRCQRVKTRLSHA